MDLIDVLIFFLLLYCCSAEDVSDNDGDRDLFHQNNEEIVRKELGLDWMLRPTSKMIENSHAHEKEETEEHEAVEVISAMLLKIF